MSQVGEGKEGLNSEYPVAIVIDNIRNEIEHAQIPFQDLTILRSVFELVAFGVRNSDGPLSSQRQEDAVGDPDMSRMCKNFTLLGSISAKNIVCVQQGPDQVPSIIGRVPDDRKTQDSHGGLFRFRAIGVPDGSRGSRLLLQAYVNLDVPDDNLPPGKKERLVREPVPICSVWVPKRQTDGYDGEPMGVIHHDVVAGATDVLGKIKTTVDRANLREFLAAVRNTD